MPRYQLLYFSTTVLLCSRLSNDVVKVNVKIVGFGICRCVHGIHGYKDRDLSVQTASNLRNFLFNGSHQAEFRCVEFQRAILLYFRIASFYFGV